MLLHVSVSDHHQLNKDLNAYVHQLMHLFISPRQH